MRRKMIFLASVVLLLGMVSSAGAATLFHWQFEGSENDEIVSDTDIQSGLVATTFVDSGIRPTDDVSLVYGEPEPWLNTETSAQFNNINADGPADNDPGVGLRVADTGVGTPLDLSNLGAFTIEAFIYARTLRQSVIVRKWQDGGQYFIDLRGNGGLRFSINADDNAAAAGEGAIEPNTWHHVAAVFDENDVAAPMKIYVDGELKGIAEWSDRVGDSSTALGIGCIIRNNDDPPSNSGQFFDGRIDEVRFSDEALEPYEFLLPEAGNAAGGASPISGARDVCPDGVVLSWTPGDNAADVNGHDVYFGTAYTDVEDAITTTPVIYKGRQDSNEYPEVGSLSVDVGVTYYWRIDEVNESDPCLWAGKVWSFTIEDGNAREPSPPNGVKGVNPNVVLSWTPACIADSHNVYLGTLYNDVLNGTGDTPKGSRVDPNYDPGGLDPYTTYYWRIAEVDGGNTYPGEVWSFKTGKGGILVYFDFDGSEDANLPATIWDNTGSVEFTKYIDGDDPGTAKYGPANPFYNVTGTSAGFTPEAGLVRDDPCDPSESDILRLDGMAYTIEMWIKVDSIPYDDTALIKKHSAWAVGMEGDHIEFRHRDNDLDGDQQLALGEWTHVAAVFDLSLPSDQKKIYINGLLDDAEDADEANPADNNAPVSIGFMRRANGSSDDYLDGQIDELAILDIPLGPGTFLFYPGFEWASDPNPYNGQRRVDPNLVLTWTPGIYANSHDVFIGTDPNYVRDATAGSHENVDYNNVDVNSYPADGNQLELELGTTYYWRVDEIGDSNTWKGLVWHFRTQSLLEDPNLRVWYELDEEEGDDIPDSSGREFDSYESSASGMWDPNGGRFKGALECDDNIGFDLANAVLETINKGITVSVWLKDSRRPTYDNTVYDAGFGEGSAAYRVQAFVPNGDGLIEWRAGNDSNDVLIWDMKRVGLNPATIEGWHHWAFVKDETDGQREISIYFDGELADSNAIVNDTLTNVRNAPSCVGAVTWHSADLVGIIDDFRVYDSALTEADVVKLFRGGEAELAWAPDPPDGATEVAWDVNLAWKPGDYTQTVGGHEIYFGTDWDDVNDMTEPCDTLALGNELYDPGQLELGKSYYWRVDEVNEPNTYKGRIWSFTVAEFVILDDFERYDSGDYRIYYTWYDQRSQDYPEATGSWLGLATPPTYPVHIGEQAMSYQFDNDDPWADLYYSEAWLPLDEIGGFQDWTSVDVRLLTVFFYGDADNDTNSTEQMYMGVMDTDGLYGEMRYGDHSGEDMNDLKVEEWQRWDVPFVWFTDNNSAAPNDVNFASVASVRIGFGNRRSPAVGGAGVVYFDDLRLSMPICKPEYGPTGDLSGDCFVGVADIGAMGDQWLRHDINVNPVTVPSDANLVAHWKLDGDANDSSANVYHGAAEGSYAWVAGKDGQAIDLSGGWAVVEDDGNTPKLRPKRNVSVMAWINRAQHTSSDIKVIIKGRDNHETYGLEINEDDEGLTFIMRDANEMDGDDPKKYDVVGELGLPLDEWVHIAGTYDGNEMTSYVNGEVAGTTTPGPNELYSNVNEGLGIGGRYGDTSGRFEGKIDDVRVYDRAVTAAEIGYMACGSDGFIPLESEANLLLDSPDPEIINFKDYATLFDYWGDEKLWPPQPAP